MGSDHACGHLHRGGTTHAQLQSAFMSGHIEEDRTHDFNKKSPIYETTKDTVFRKYTQIDSIVISANVQFTHLFH
jgi:hypothetical protein